MSQPGFYGPSEMGFFEISFVKLFSLPHLKLHHLLKSQDKEKDAERFFFVTVVNPTTYKGDFWDNRGKQDTGYTD